MTTTSILGPAGRSLPSSLSEAFARGDVVLFRFALLLALLTAPTLMLMTAETRLFNGVNVWMKPFKFELSLSIYVATLALLASFVDDRWRQARIYRWMVAAFVTVTMFNIFYIIFRAARAEGSHFNSSTPVADALYGVMGVGALVQVGLAGLIGFAVLRSQERSIAPALRLSIGVGLISAAILTLICGGYMSMHGSHWVGGVQSDADGIPFFSWSRTGGDLRVAHFMGTHAMHFLPIAGLVAARFDGGRGWAIVWIAVAFWTVLTLAAFAQAIAGIPLLPR